MDRTTRLRALAAPAAVALGGVGVCAFVLAADPTTPGGLTPPCPTRALLGFTCPGCGCARMLYSLLHGDVGAALHFNALALLALPVLVWTWLAWTLRRTGLAEPPQWQHWRWAPAVVLSAVAVWWVVRLIPGTTFANLRI